METYNVEGAAEFLNISTDTMKDLAGSGAVPGAKIGKGWVFYDEDLVEYLRAEIRRQTNERRGIKSDAPKEEQKAKTAFQNSNTKRRPFRAPPSLSMNP